MASILRVLTIVICTLLLSTQILFADETEGTVEITETAEVAIIKGRLTTSYYVPIPEAQVILIDPDAPDEEIVAATTDISGRYTVTQPISNTWILKFDPENSTPWIYNPHIAEYYNDVYTFEEATPITAEVGTVTQNIDASLSVLGQVTGRVTDEANGQPLANILIRGVGTDWFTASDGAGYYTFTTYATGDFTLRFDPPNKSNYAFEYYNDKTNPAEADVLTATADRDMRDVNISLKPGGQIKGTVTSSWRGDLIEYPTAFAYDENGELLQAGSRFGEPGNPYPPDPQGHYTIYNLPPGDYRVVFNANQHQSATSELVHLEQGETVSNINAQLKLTVTVTSIGTSPAVPDTIALAFAHDPTPVISANGGRTWEVVSAPWIVDRRTYSFPDRYAIHSMSVGVVPGNPPGGGTKFLTFIGDSNGELYLRQGIYRSGDFGINWAKSEIDQETPAECNRMWTNRLVASPRTPTDLYILYTCGNYSNVTRLLVSDNAGIAWRDVTTVDGRSLVLDYLSKVVASPTVDNRIYLYSAGGGWRISHNSGATWEPKSFPVESLALDAVNADYLYGWSLREYVPDSPFQYTRNGKRSTDGGNNWVDWAEQPCPYSYNEEPPQLIAHPTESQILFLRCDGYTSVGIYRSDNGGNSWQKLQDQIGQMLVADLGNPGRLLWMRDDGLWASTDKGESWQLLLAEYALFETPLYLPSVSAETP